MTTQNLINVAPSSTEGHFVKGARKVIELDAISETYRIEGKSELVTKNHTTLKMDEDCLVSCHQVYNPFTALYEKSND